jgi:hypothetical protein
MIRAARRHFLPQNGCCMITFKLSQRAFPRHGAPDLTT